MGFLLSGHSPPSHHILFLFSLFSPVRLLAAPWTVACQAPLSMEFSRQEYHHGLPFSSLGDLPNPGIEPASPALAGGFFTTEPPGKPPPCLTTFYSSVSIQVKAFLTHKSRFSFFVLYAYRTRCPASKYLHYYGDLISSCVCLLACTTSYIPN